MSTPSRRCYLHVGLPKTGTSYLQSMLWASRDALAAQGLELPMDKPADHFHATLALRGLLRESMDPPHAFTALERLAAAMPQVPSPRALITHESLAPTTPAQAERLAGMLAGFELHVIITARDIARQVASGWQQRIQERQVHGYDEFLDAVVHRRRLAHDFWINQDLVDVAAHWSTVVPPERLHIVTVPPAGSAPDVLPKRFCTLIEVDPATLSRATAESNLSLGRVQAELLRRVNVALGDRLPHARAGYARVGKRYLAGLMLAPQAGEPPRIPQRFAEWTRQHATGTIERLEQEGYDVVGDLAELIPTRPSGPIQDQVVTDSDLADAAVRALADILEHRHGELADTAALRDRVRQQGRRLRQQSQRIAELESRSLTARLTSLVTRPPR